MRKKNKPVKSNVSEDQYKRGPRLVFRIPKLLKDEFCDFVVSQDGRGMAEVIRSLISEAVRDAKRIKLMSTQTPRTVRPPVH